MARLTNGDKAPEFKLFDQHNNQVTLNDYRGSKVLLYFYPRANTPGCTVQSKAVSEAREELAQLNCQVIGISPDKPEKQLKFDTKHELGFPLLADTEYKVAESYGAWGEKKLYGKTFLGIIRSAFLIDENGIIIESWYKVKPKDTVPNVLKILAPNN